MEKAVHPQAFFDDEDPDATDKEWDEFMTLVGTKKKRQTQSFYPSPPPEDDYISTLIYGQYSKQLGEFAKLEALRSAEKRRQKVEKARKKEIRGYQGKFAKTVSFIWKHTFARLGEDWVFLALLGFIMAVFSFLMDNGISLCNQARIWLYYDLTQHAAAQYAAWVSLPLCLVLFSAGFAHFVAPQSIVIGLTATLGSGLPLGKEGPFVHIASITATLLSKIVTGFQSIYENESRTTEMLAAACAVGVASCFAAPVGGVLFSIEVTTVYFAVRNYWRGFFGAVCGATTFRLLAVWFQSADTVTAVFKTNFNVDIPFDPQELFVFALMGAFCGLGGAFYVWTHRQYVMLMRKSKLINMFLQKNRFLYPGLIALIVSTLTFPLWTGNFIAGDLTTHQQVVALFSNFTWTKEPNVTVDENNTIKHWQTPYTGVLINLACYTAFTFIFSIISMTIPIPSGSFIPVFKIGAGIGRIVGELMHIWFPTGMRYGGQIATIIPGGYATVGAAAFSGAVTHTISVSVIVFEMTGQITHLIPIMIAVLISNAIASLLGPSLYDSIILIKKLPYLPDLLPSSSGMYKVFVEDFMVRDVKYIFDSMTYEQLKQLLKINRTIQSFPLVENPESMVLLGSIQRAQLIQLIEKHIGKERRLQVAAIRKRREEEIKAQKQVEEWTRYHHRFHVVPAPDVLYRQFSETQLNNPPTYNPVFGTQPKKSILKKTNSFTLKGFAPFVNTSPNSTPYTTVTGAESRIRSAFEAIYRKSAQLQDVERTSQSTIRRSGSLENNNKDIDITNPVINKKVQLPKERIIDMSPEDQRIWEDEQMQLSADFSGCHIDPAPFQLVERTSLLKVHSLFSMVGVKIAYVTAIGKLVGVVGLKELRMAIENANSGHVPNLHLVTSDSYNSNNNNLKSSPENADIIHESKI